MIRQVQIVSYERELDIPFDVIRLDDRTYVVPHGLRIDTELLIRAGVVNISLVNRNITAGPLIINDEEAPELDSHPQFPADEFLSVKGIAAEPVRFSYKLLQLLGMTIERIFEHFFEANQKLLNIDPSQLSIAKGKLIFGEYATEQMNVVWTGDSFFVAPASTKLLSSEELVVEIEGSIVGGQFRCKYGMLDILRRQ
jgi:hypothetical protein